MLEAPHTLVPRLLDAAVAAIAQNAELLSDLDRAIGDGDHGVNMQRGFSAIAGQRGEIAGMALPRALDAMGKLLILNVGGASGPLYGSLLLAMAKAAARDDASVQALIDEGVAAVKKRGKAEPGEKTMLDVLVPVQLAWRAAREQALDLTAALDRVRTAAKAGLEATRPLQASKGRAAFLRERSIGHLDPGACSSFLLVDAVCTVCSPEGAAPAAESRKP